MTLPPFLTGDAITLRALSPDDAPLMVRWINDPAVGRNITVVRPSSLQDELDFIEKARTDRSRVVFGIALKEEGRLIGVTGLMQIDERNRHAGFGIQIGDTGEWNKGYGTEATRLVVDYAFRTLNLNRVWLRVYEYNPGGQRAYGKAGFQREGVQRQDNFREGRYWDTIMMAVLRSEWKTEA